MSPEERILNEQTAGSLVFSNVLKASPDKVAERAGLAIEHFFSQEGMSDVEKGKALAVITQSLGRFALEQPDTPVILELSDEHGLPILYRTRAVEVMRVVGGQIIIERNSTPKAA